MNDSPAVSTMAAPTSKVALSMIGAWVLGRMCRSSSLARPAPSASAAETYLFAFTASTCAHQPGILRPEHDHDRDQRVLQPRPQRRSDRHRQNDRWERLKLGGSIYRVAAEAGPGEDRLGQHGTGQQASEGEPDDGDSGDQRVAERVADDDPLLGEPLGPSRADVVETQDLEQRGTRYPGDDAHGIAAKHYARQDQMVEGVEEDVSLAG